MILEMVCLLGIVFLLISLVSGFDGGEELLALGCSCFVQLGCLAGIVIFITTIVFFTWNILSQ